MALIVDTGPLFAAMDAADPDHVACRDLLRDTDEQLIVTVPVLVETEWLSDARLGAGAFDHVLASVADGGLALHDLDLDGWSRVRELRTRYADLSLGLADASVIVAAERLGEQRIATLDHRHFRVVRPSHVRSFTLLPDIS